MLKFTIKWRGLNNLFLKSNTLISPILCVKFKLFNIYFIAKMITSTDYENNT